MALRPDRDYYAHDDISHFWAKHTPGQTAQKGGIASLVTSGSGVSLGNPVNTVDYVADPSGAVPKGVMLADVSVYQPTTRFFRNPYNGEVLEGEKVCLIRHGWVVTDMVIGNPNAGDTAYLGASGNVSPTQADGAPVVGKFETPKDQDGFTKLFVDL